MTTPYCKATFSWLSRWSFVSSSIILYDSLGILSRKSYAFHMVDVFSCFPHGENLSYFPHDGNLLVTFLMLEIFWLLSSRWESLGCFPDRVEIFSLLLSWWKFLGCFSDRGKIFRLNFPTTEILWLLSQWWPSYRQESPSLNLQYNNQGKVMTQNKGSTDCWLEPSLGITKLLSLSLNISGFGWGKKKKSNFFPHIDSSSRVHI